MMDAVNRQLMSDTFPAYEPATDGLLYPKGHVS